MSQQSPALQPLSADGDGPRVLGLRKDIIGYRNGG